MFSSWDPGFLRRKEVYHLMAALPSQAPQCRAAQPCPQVEAALAEPCLPRPPGSDLLRSAQAPSVTNPHLPPAHTATAPSPPVLGHTGKTPPNGFPTPQPPPAKSPRCFSPRPAPCPPRVVTTSKAGQTSPVRAPRGSPLTSRRQREDGAMPSPSLQKLPQLTPGCADCLLRPRQSHIPAALPQPTRPTLRTIL